MELLNCEKQIKYVHERTLWMKNKLWSVSKRVDFFQYIIFEAKTVFPISIINNGSFNRNDNTTSKWYLFTQFYIMSFYIVVIRSIHLCMYTYIEHRFLLFVIMFQWTKYTLKVGRNVLEYNSNPIIDMPTNHCCRIVLVFDNIMTF